MAKIALVDLDGVLNEYSGKYNEYEVPKIKKGAKEAKTKPVPHHNHITEKELQKELELFLKSKNLDSKYKIVIEEVK